MKISIVCGDLKRNFEPSYYFHRLRELGFEAVDFGVCEDYNKIPQIFTRPYGEWTTFFRRQASEAKKANIDIYQTHLTFPTNLDGNDTLSDECFIHLCKEIEASAILGAKYVVIHPINLAVNDFRKEENFKINVDALGRFNDVLKQYDLFLGVEDMFGWDSRRNRYCKTGCSTPNDMVKLIDTLNTTLNSDRYVACLDTGHMLIHSIEPQKAIRILGNRTKLLHLHDNYGVSDNHLVPGFGLTDWKEVALALKDVQYNGTFNLEIDFAPILDKFGEQAVWDYAKYCYAISKSIIDKAEL